MNRDNFCSRCTFVRPVRAFGLEQPHAANIQHGQDTTPITIKPIPPNHCKIERQSRMLGAISSSPLRTVEPVVVIPDMVSKYASVKLMWLMNTKGRAANALAIVQTSDVIKKRSRTPRRNSAVRPMVKQTNATPCKISTD